MHLGGGGGANRVVFTVGKFAVTDVFDTNRYAHDARSDFLNWTALDAGTLDYAADAWGYTVGAAAQGTGLRVRGRCAQELSTSRMFRTAHSLNLAPIISSW